MTTAYNEVIDFLAGGVTPEQLVAFRPSPEAARRFEGLIRKEKTGGLLPDETAELNRMMEVERVMSLVKVRARAKLSRP